jgi:hypothetical protein
MAGSNPMWGVLDISALIEAADTNTAKAVKPRRKSRRQSRKKGRNEKTPVSDDESRQVTQPLVIICTVCGEKVPMIVPDGLTILFRWFPLDIIDRIMTFAKYESAWLQKHGEFGNFRKLRMYLAPTSMEPSLHATIQQPPCIDRKVSDSDDDIYGDYENPYSVDDPYSIGMYLSDDDWSECGKPESKKRPHHYNCMCSTCAEAEAHGMTDDDDDEKYDEEYAQFLEMNGAGHGAGYGAGYDDE